MMFILMCSPEAEKLPGSIAMLKWTTGFTCKI